MLAWRLPYLPYWIFVLVPVLLQLCFLPYSFWICLEFISEIESVNPALEVLPKQ
jgi:hypothetical protein